MHTLVINTVGEPGSGKSTLSFWLVHELKMRGIHAEFVPEVIKYESYDPSGIARVRSGRFDQRYLALQHAMTKPLIGTAEVVVNDGSLPPFAYYAAQRLSPEAQAGFRARIDRYMAEQQPADHRYVTVERKHAYSTSGRRQDEAESLAMRQAIFANLRQEFGITPVTLPSKESARAPWLDALVEEVLQRRAEAAPAQTRRRLVQRQ